MKNIAYFLHWTTMKRKNKKKHITQKTRAYKEKATFLASPQTHEYMNLFIEEL